MCLCVCFDKLLVNICARKMSQTHENDLFNEIVNDNYFNDVFSIQSQALNDFDFGLEAVDVDNLLELFEEREKLNSVNHLLDFSCINIDCSANQNNGPAPAALTSVDQNSHETGNKVNVVSCQKPSVSPSSQPVVISALATRSSQSRNSLLVSNVDQQGSQQVPQQSCRRKGISLLAKPRKSGTNNNSSSGNQNNNSIGVLPKDFVKTTTTSNNNKIASSNFKSEVFSIHFHQDHTYCSADLSETGYYNKLPGYLSNSSLAFKKVKQADIEPKSEEEFDKLPNYITAYSKCTNVCENVLDVDDFLDSLGNSDSSRGEQCDILTELVFFSEEEAEIISEFIEENMGDIEVPYQEESDNLDNGLEDSSSSNMCFAELRKNENSDYLDDFENNKFNHSNTHCQSSNSATNRFRNRTVSTRSSVDSIRSTSESDSRQSSSSCDSFDSRSSKSKRNRRKNNSEKSRNVRRYSASSASDSDGCEEIYKNNLTKRSKVDTRNSSFPYATTPRNYSKKDMNNRISSNSCNTKAAANSSSFSNRNSLPHDKRREIEERRIVYVGKIPEGATKTDLRRWFGRFGAIKEVSVHFRDHRVSILPGLAALNDKLVCHSTPCFRHALTQTFLSRITMRSSPSFAAVMLTKPLKVSFGLPV